MSRFEIKTDPEGRVMAQSMGGTVEHPPAFHQIAWGEAEAKKSEIENSHPDDRRNHPFFK